jgi:hypothetical protein
LDGYDIKYVVVEGSRDGIATIVSDILRIIRK